MMPDEPVTWGVTYPTIIEVEHRPMSPSRDATLIFGDHRGNRLYVTLSPEQQRRLVSGDLFHYDPLREATNLYVTGRIETEEMESRIDRALASPGRFR